MSIRSAAAVLGAAAVIAAGCGGDEEDDPLPRTDSRKVNLERLEIIKAQVRRKELPPITLRMFDLNGAPDLGLIDGPKGDRDVIRTRANGTKGPPLKWDLDQNGKIEPEEREITERELYDATLPAFAEAQRRVAAGPDGRKS